MDRVVDKLIKTVLLGLLGFFLAEFYLDTKSTSDALVEISKNTAVTANTLTNFKKELNENDITDKKQDREIELVKEGLSLLDSEVSVLETRVNYLEGSK